MRLETLLRPESTLVIRDAADADAVLEELARAAERMDIGAPAATLKQALSEREAQVSTATPEGVAFPHALLPSTTGTALLAARLDPPVQFGASSPVDLVFCMFGSPEKPWEHVRLLARLARIARAPGALDRLRGAKDERKLYDLLIEEDRTHV